MEDNKPFSKSYVLRTTSKHIRKAIDISIRKTFERMSDFDGDSQKGKEVMETLSVLHTLRGMIDEFQSHNKELFTEKE